MVLTLAKVLKYSFNVGDSVIQLGFTLVIVHCSYCCSDSGNTSGSVFATQVDFKKTNYWLSTTVLVPDFTGINVLSCFPTGVVCFAAAENCSGYRTCGQCLDQPGCGWCTDPNNTGKGQCIEGSYRGPFQTSVPAPSTLPGLPASPQPALNASMCPSDAKYNWSFIHCPGRQELPLCFVNITFLKY